MNMVKYLAAAGLQMKGYLLTQLVKWESERNNDKFRRRKNCTLYCKRACEERQPEKRQLFGVNLLPN